MGTTGQNMGEVPLEVGAMLPKSLFSPPALFPTTCEG